ncbi:MAG: hypothetical protein DSY47_07525 [Hydrogenothermus sp.]|nr:MAG: hypothetical protein DSY47_07525 [Hydrogenothermus sp.]
MIDENYLIEAIKAKFKNAKVYPCKELNISKQFYKLGDELYIKAKFFVKEMYLKNDTKWGEKFYEEIFKQPPKLKDIVDFVNIKNCICVDIDAPLDIVILKREVQKKVSKGFSVRIFKKKISASTVKEIGSSSEFFIENSKVEILKNDKVVAYGILQNKEGKTFLKITEVLE